MNFWLITDTHFNHDNIKTYCKRPDDWSKQVLDNWRRLVRNEDIIFHLGDVIIGKRQHLLPTIGWLPGRKILIRGNHDNESYSYYLENGFEFVCESLVFNKALLTHAPANSLPGNALVNVHGHLHNFAETNPVEYEDWAKKKQPWHKLLALEYVNYSPVEFYSFVGDLGRIDLV